MRDLNAREASMVRVALQSEAKRYRRLAKSRPFAGPAFAGIRKNARIEAQCYEDLAEEFWQGK